jgi:hypothetical protein
VEGTDVPEKAPGTRDSHTFTHIGEARLDPSVVFRGDIFLQRWRQMPRDDSFRIIGQKSKIKEEKTGQEKTREEKRRQDKTRQDKIK